MSVWTLNLSQEMLFLTSLWIPVLFKVQSRLRKWKCGEAKTYSDGWHVLIRQSLLDIKACSKQLLRTTKKPILWHSAIGWMTVFMRGMSTGSPLLPIFILSQRSLLNESFIKTSSYDKTVLSHKNHAVKNLQTNWFLITVKKPFSSRWVIYIPPWSGLYESPLARRKPKR